MITDKIKRTSSILTNCLWVICAVKEYTPFISIHTKRLHAISILMIGLAIVPGVVEIIMIQRVQPTVKTNVSFEFSYLVVAVIFFCLAQIFDYGRLLQQQSDETL